MKNPSKFQPQFRPGERVQTHPATDTWMRGDRYGTVIKHSKLGVYVAMDRSGRKLRFHPDNLISEGMPNPKRRTLGVPEKHQLRIARHTLKMSDVGARIMGGPTKAEARAIIQRLTGKAPQDNPRRRRRNPNGWQSRHSETAAWKSVESYALRILERKAAPAIHRQAEDIRAVASVMLTQLGKGTHVNPTLAVLGNPPGQVLSTHTYGGAIRYRHRQDGKDYRHTFGAGSSILLLRDGSIQIKHPTKRLWEDM